MPLRALTEFCPRVIRTRELGVAAAPDDGENYYVLLQGKLNVITLEPRTWLNLL